MPKEHSGNPYYKLGGHSNVPNLIAYYINPVVFHFRFS